MKNVSSIIRVAVTVSLLLSVPAASVCPRLNAGEARTVAATRGDQGQKICCCGTADGRCCGTACCQLPNPKNDKAPATPNRSDERSQPVGFNSVADAPNVGSARPAFRRLIESDAGSTDSTSLIALSIRLNI